MSHHLTFEEKFRAFVPHETRISNSLEHETKAYEHDEAGILVKLVAYLIDIALMILIIPIIYNVYHYFKRGQTGGQQIVGIRIYRFRHHNKLTIASIHQLLLRFVSKLLFVASWAIIGVNLIMLWLGNIQGESGLAVRILYIVIMVGRTHAYVLPMWFNKHHRGLQDIRAGTVVAYDHGHQIKRTILGVILCVCLYYMILIIGPNIIELLSHYTSGSWSQTYRSVWAWIDYWVLYGLYSMGLANGY